MMALLFIIIFYHLLSLAYRKEDYTGTSEQIASVQLLSSDKSSN